MATYGPGENAFNFVPVEEGGDRTDTAFAKTKAQFDALYENLNRDIPGVYPSNENPRPNGIATPGADITYARGQHVHPLQENVSGNAGSATKLATGRTIQTDLGSTAAPSFDGTANVTPGVKGILPVAQGGTGASALSGVTVGNATKATQDSRGQQIDSTYIKNLSVNGRTVTYTRGNGTTGSFQTQDTNTTYTLASLGGAPRPTASNWIFISSARNLTIPSGGTWAYYYKDDNIGNAGICAGGTVLNTDRFPRGFAWRIA